MKHWGLREEEGGTPMVKGWERGWADNWCKGGGRGWVVVGQGVGMWWCKGGVKGIRDFVLFLKKLIYFPPFLLNKLL